MKNLKRKGLLAIVGVFLFVLSYAIIVSCSYYVYIIENENGEEIGTEYGIICWTSHSGWVIDRVIQVDIWTPLEAEVLRDF